MSTTNQTQEGFQVKRYEIRVDGSNARTWEQIEAEHGPAPTSLRRRDDHHDVTTDAIFDAHQLTIADNCLPWQDRFLAALHVLASQLPDEALAIELIDSICAAAARKLERKDRDVDRAMREYRKVCEGDKETEIGRAQLHDAEDRVNKLRDDLDNWEQIGKTAQRAFEQTSLRNWQDRTTGVAISDVTEAAKWERQYRTMKLMQRTRIVFTGGNQEHELDQIRPWLEATKRKVGDNLTIVVTDAESGFDATVRKEAKALGIETFAVPLDSDAPGNKKFFDRARSMIHTLAPHGVVVIGGRGLQAEVLNLARNAKIKHVAPVAPVAA